jgi:hypothetical protein
MFSLPIVFNTFKKDAEATGRIINKMLWNHLFTMKFTKIFLPKRSPVIVFIKSHSVVIVLQPSSLLLAPAHSLAIFLFEGNCGNNKNQKYKLFTITLRGRCNL